MTLVLILSAGLVALMAGVELANFRRTRSLTFLTAVHGLIALGYCLPPYLITFLPGTRWEAGPNASGDANPWGTRLYILDLADHLALPPATYLTLGIILFGAYVALLGGYFVVSHFPVAALDTSILSSRNLAWAGAVLGAIAVAALALYATQFDSFYGFIRKGAQHRSGLINLKWGFLQVLTQLGFPAFLLIAAAAGRSRGNTRALLVALAAVVWTAACLRILHTGGRLELGAFLAVPIAGWLFLHQRSIKMMAILAVLALGLYVLASFQYKSFFNPGLIIDSMHESLSWDALGKSIYVLSEFAFPHIVAAHALTLVPHTIEFRYFIDIPLGALYMLPSFTGVETLPPMILSLQAKILPWMPVDLFSFGYYSLGTAGVLIIFAGFGAVLAVFDGWLTESTGWLGQALRAGWLFYLPFRLFYADPYAAAYSGFGLIVGTLVIAAIAVLSRSTGGPKRP